MTASPKFKKKATSSPPQMAMLHPTRVDYDKPVVEPEMITFDKTVEKTDAESGSNSGTKKNPFDSPKMAGKDVKPNIPDEDGLTKNPFDDENDGWGDSDDDF